MRPHPATDVIYKLNAPSFHWHLAQGIRAVEADLYIPGVLSIIAGIEHSIRLTLYQLTGDLNPIECDDLGAYMSGGSLLNDAKQAGMPVDLLAFPDEDDFEQKVADKKKVRLVVVRNDLAHGNVSAFINTDLGEGNSFFTPECIRDVAEELVSMATAWAEGIAEFRSEQLDL